MFDDQEPKDMFAGTDNAPATPTPSVAPAPIVSPPTRLPTTYGALPPVAPSTPGHSEPHRGGAFTILLIVAVVLVVFGISGFFAYRIMVQPADDSSVVDSVSDTGVTSGTGSDTADTPLPTAEDDSMSTPVETINPATLLDSDGDGLTNARELDVGTSVTKADTDGDGLGDREEVEVYGTNARKADTDGDGYLDGQEVSGGYNPNGEGKLFAVPTGS
jgi:hypothetical protein